LLLLALIVVAGAAIAVPALSRRTAAPPAPPPPLETGSAPVVARPPAAPAKEELSPAPPLEVKHDERSLEDVVARALPAVASIQAGQARGTGFFVRRDTVVTNAHVIDGQSIVKLQVGDRTYLARVVNVSPGSDLAVLTLDQAGPAQATLELGSSAQARVGQEVIAIGSALGVLSNTVTRGIVSAVRQVGPVTLLQTDAAINPGNSGGPLLDRNGVVIGVNSMAVAKQAGEGVAFAVAIDHVTQLLDGAPPLQTTQTPLNGLQQLFTSPGEADGERVRGERELTQTLGALARAGDQLDAFWNRYKSSCVTSAYARGSRPWFGLFMPNGVAINQTSLYDCAAWLQTAMEHANEIRAGVEHVMTAARKTGVFPGTVRDLLRQNRLDWERN
jgi:putative serine protease PepD